MQGEEFQRIDETARIPLIRGVNLVELAVLPSPITEDFIRGVRKKIERFVPFAFIYAELPDSAGRNDRRPPSESNLLKHLPQELPMVLIQGQGALLRNQEILAQMARDPMTTSGLAGKLSPPLMPALEETILGIDQLGMSAELFGQSENSSVIASRQCSLILEGRSPERMNPVIRLRDLVGNTWYKIWWEL